ncbi:MULTISPECIES: nuclear transport factor 2 family protein [Actinomycetes]|uniref:SnoaL-like domain-containing protein n=2 Tax=Actinomycetes TaxID=1760 RepID=A0ABP8SVD2_9ACTN|nr:nuclear transport factor 2 family protein [Streptomyces sp. CMSTAAHL-2]MCE3031991.1 nuclear transport factor 2 family protein [Streptomyces sp. CMSTAAHL-2]
MTSATADFHLIDRQIDAFNRQALDDFMACYSPHATVSTDGEVVAAGTDALRALYARQFSEAPLTATVLSRLSQAEWIVDREQVEGDGIPPLSVLALYRVRDGLIDQVQFVGRQAE